MVVEFKNTEGKKNRLIIKYVRLEEFLHQWSMGFSIRLKKLQSN